MRPPEPVRPAQTAVEDSPSRILRSHSQSPGGSRTPSRTRGGGAEAMASPSRTRGGGAEGMATPSRTRRGSAQSPDPQAMGGAARKASTPSRTRRGGAQSPDPQAMGGAGGSGSGDAAQAKRKKKGGRPPNSACNKNASVEHFKTRFSVYRIRDTTPFISETKKEWIREAGFGALLSLSQFSVPGKLVRWVMEHVDPLLCKFRFGKKVIVFNRELVCNILGLQNNNLPVKLSGGDLKEVKKLREVYKDGERAKISKCIDILAASNDKESFIRAFTLLALGTVYCPGTGNYVSLKYLHSLVDLSQLSSFDWAGHIIECLMDEVKKYQKFTPQQLASDHQIGSCLIILVIAYLDFLDLPSDRGTHQINYSLPRICNVTNADFEFVMNVDRRKLQLGHQFGKLPFRDISRTPYANSPASFPEKEPIVPNIPEEVPVISSLGEWLHQQQESNIYQLQQIPIEYQEVAAQYSSLIEQDVMKLADSISATFKEQVMCI